MPNPSAIPQGRQRRGAAGYERRDASAPWIFGIVGFLLVAGLTMHFVLAGIVKALKQTPPPADAFLGVRRNPEISPARAFPRLQISPALDLKAFREQEDAELNGYGWIDRTAGVVRIPVARAMDLLLQRGLPVRTGINGSKLGPSSFELQQQRPLEPQPEIQEEK